MIVVPRPHDLMRAWVDITRPAWDYSPGYAPFQWQRFVIEGRAEEWGISWSLPEALDAFVSCNAPRPGQFAQLIDSTGYILIAWYDLEQEVNRYRWAGCQAAFERVAELRPQDAEWQMEVACWERIANKETV